MSSLPFETNSIEQSVLTSLAQCEAASNDALIGALTLLSRTNGINAVQHGARLAVIGELLISMLVHLPASMKADVTRSFRNRIEVLMSLSDDRCLPEEYHSALLTEINRYLSAVR
ncbi:hypothetical protein PQR67_36930 [Paraburkholderia fungorum]|uniref:hypothetical protein n=1 Tax=Paraburkholderia fungorum TaxID=134537 RepID=UPI0038B6FD9F